MYVQCISMKEKGTGLGAVTVPAMSQVLFCLMAQAKGHQNLRDWFQSIGQGILCHSLTDLKRQMLYI